MDLEEMKLWNNSKKYTHPNVHSSTTYNSQDMETTQVPIKDYWFKKSGVCIVCVCVCVCVCTYTWFVCTHTHILEYYSAIKRNKIMTFAATWMELESIIQSGVRERQILCALTYMLACPLSRSYLCLEHIMLYIRAVSSSWMLGWEDRTSRDAANAH